MSPDLVILTVSRLAVGAITTFLAILVWSRTRDSAWMFVVIATVAQYGEIVAGTLESFGIVRLDGLVIAGVPLFRVLLLNLPMVFLSIALLVVLAGRR
ncbi:MAG: hypothetical protein EA428_01675 [Spirochaetaceae bacterium]|nr:MAG: hypothetical protein EA428_01675 [Spirochaetaceae bacterium]